MAKRRRQSANKYPELKGFQSVEEYLDQGRFKVFLNVRALGKCGKTRFLCTAPKPLAYYNIDNSCKGPIDKLPQDERDGIKLFTILYDQEDQAFSAENWARFKESYDAVLSGSYFRSVCIDTQDELLICQRVAYFGSRRPTQFEYGVPNTEFLSLLKIYHNYDKNLLVATRMDHEYKEKKVTQRSGKVVTVSQRTGRYVAKGKMEVEEYLPEVNVQLYRFQEHEDPDDEDSPLVRRFGLQISKLRVGEGPEVEGDVLETPDDDINFRELMVKIYPDTREQDWE